MTLDRLGLYVRTASYLRTGQLGHALYRRVRPRSDPRRARDVVHVRFRRALVPTLHSNRSFAVARGVAIDWRSPEASRLSRYHLHYFDFLGDESRSDDWKRSTLGDWIEKNPADTEDAWDPYPISLRIVNWIKFLDRDRANVERNWLESLYAQTLWLENNLERRVLANHYFKNAKALIFAGSYFDGADAERWLETGRDILLAQTREQFLADGGHYERSPMYHLICLEDLLDVVNVATSTAALVAPEAIETFRSGALRALKFLDSILMPDDAIPLFNDAAFGVGPEPADVFAYARDVVGYGRPARDRALSVRALADSGYYVIRDGADMLAIDCGVPGPPYQPGHGHADCLSYELALGGERVVVDSGVCDYEWSASRRYARSTAAHSTVTVDGQDQSELWGVFRMGRRARPISPELTLREREASFVGAHDGFQRFGDRVVHRRSVRYRDRSWAFDDYISGRGEHRVESRIHLAPLLRARVCDGEIEVRGSGGRILARIATSANVSIAIGDAPYYPRFGTTEMRDVIVLTYCGPLPATLSYAIERVAERA